MTSSQHEKFFKCKLFVSVNIKSCKRKLNAAVWRATSLNMVSFVFQKVIFDYIYFSAVEALHLHFNKLVKTVDSMYTPKFKKSYA